MSRRFIRNLSVLTLFLLSLVLWSGCGPQPPERSEFEGEVVTELPEVPGAEERYALPELEETLEEVKKAEEEKKKGFSH